MMVPRICPHRRKPPQQQRGKTISGEFNSQDVANTTGGDDLRGFQLAECCKHTS